MHHTYQDTVVSRYHNTAASGGYLESQSLDASAPSALTPTNMEFASSFRNLTHIHIYMTVTNGGIVQKNCCRMRPMFELQILLGILFRERLSWLPPVFHWASWEPEGKKHGEEGAP